MEKKYKLLMDDCKKVKDVDVYAIEALKDFTDKDGYLITKGNVGGYIESEDSLSQEGVSWVYPNATVYDGANVTDDAYAGEPDSAPGVEVVVRRNSTISGKSAITGKSKINDSAKITGNAFVKDSTIVGNVLIDENTHVYNSNIINTDSPLNHSHIGGNSSVENSIIIGASEITGDVWLSKVHLLNEVTITERAVISCADLTTIIGPATIRSNADYLLVSGVSEYIKQEDDYENDTDNDYGAGAFIAYVNDDDEIIISNNRNCTFELTLRVDQMREYIKSPMCVFKNVDAVNDMCDYVEKHFYRRLHR